MNLLQKLGVAACIFAGSISGFNPSVSAKGESEKPLELSNFDTSIKPGDDFFRYSNGGWMKNNPIPDEYSRWGSFNILGERNQEQIKTIIDEVVKRPGKGEGRKIADFYNVAMDEQRIEKEGIAPLRPYLNSADKVKNFKDVMAEIAKMHKTGFAPIFAVGVQPDEKNSTMNIMGTYQAGLGLGNRDYYTDDNERSKMLRGEYQKHIAKMFGLVNGKTDNSDIAKSIFELEKKLAETSLTMLEQRNPVATYNMLTVAELQKMCPAINWTEYLKNIGIKDPGKINVTSLKYFRGISKIIESTPIDTWKNYLKWNYIRGFADYLNEKMVDEKFNFYGKIFSGSQVIQPRWKRALGTTSGALGEAIGKLYCEKYFPPKAKARMLELVKNLRSAFDERIQGLTWMSDNTKKIARDKLASMSVKIGYPDKWKDYSKLNVSSSNSYLQNAVNAEQFAFEDMMSECNKKVDNTKWYMTPQTVNAYYSPNSNEIVFPAGILQPPFFFIDGDDAINYGGIGGVIGHEMTHGFDDQGCQYDKNGNLNNWWTEEDSKRFKEKTQVLVEQFNKYDVLGEKVNGELTLGENIADLGGITLAHTALTNLQKGKNIEKIDGFTQEQRLMLSWSQVWRSNTRDEEALRRLKDDVHSPAEARVNGLMPNLPFFQSAFNVKPGDKLYRPTEEQAVIW